MKFEKIFISIFFISFLTIGLNVYKDYGISVDEVGYRHQGVTILYTLNDYFFPEFSEKIASGKDYFTIPELQKTQIFSGIPFHIFTTILEFLSGAKNKVEALQLKHLLTFLVFFLGVYCFFLILNLKFKNYKFALLGASFLILSPRIFAQSFYNPNDIPFMSSIIFISYFYLKFFQKFKTKHLIYSCIFSSISIGLRPMAIYMPALFMIGLIYIFSIKKIDLNTLLKKIFIFIILILILSYILNPPIWISPIKIIIQQFQWAINSSVTDILYLGKFYPNTETPWHYLIVWISVTTPILYLILFFFGILRILTNLINEIKVGFDKIEINDLFILLVFLIPFVAAIVLSKSLLNGWRHLYFIYPFIIFISMIGLKWIFDKNKKLKYLIVFPICLSLIDTSYTIYKNHPFQMTYFNLLAGKDVQDKFELDYWGVSNKAAIKYILDNDNRKKINIYGISRTKLSYTVDFFLYPEEQKRISLVKNIEEADYIITVYNGYVRRKDIINDKFKIFNEIKSGDAIINSTFIK